MKRILIISLISALLFVGVFFQLRSNQEVALERIYLRDNTATVSIRTEKVELQPLTDGQLLIGTFQADKEVTLMPQTQGEIVYLDLEEGDSGWSGVGQS